MKNNKWFAQINQEDMDLRLDPGEFVVYVVIKSFCGSGTFQKDISIRDIRDRCSLSVEYIRRLITKLVEKKVINIVGKIARRGGQVNVYKVSTGNDTYSNKVSTPVPESVYKSEAKLTLNKKISKENKQNFLKNIPVAALGILKKDFGFSEKVIKSEALKAFDWTEAKGKTYKSYYAFLYLLSKNTNACQFFSQ